MILGHMGTLDSERGRERVPCHSVSEKRTPWCPGPKRLVSQPLSISSQVQIRWQIPRLGVLNLGPLIVTLSWVDGGSGVHGGQTDNPPFRFPIA